VIGIVIAVSLIIVSEAAMAGFEVVRSGVGLEWTAGKISGQKGVAMEMSIVSRRQEVFHGGSNAPAQTPTRYYAFDEMRVNPSVVDGARIFATSAYDERIPPLKLLEMQDPDVLRRDPQILPAGSQIAPFFHYFEASNFYFLFIKTPIALEAHRDVATLTDPETKIRYVIAAIGTDRLILIPIHDYETAHLPLHEAEAE